MAEQETKKPCGRPARLDLWCPGSESKTCVETNPTNAFDSERSRNTVESTVVFFVLRTSVAILLHRAATSQLLVRLDDWFLVFIHERLLVCVEGHLPDRSLATCSTDKHPALLRDRVAPEFTRCCGDSLEALTQAKL